MALVCTFAATNTAADYLAMTITSLLVLSSASAVAEKKKERESSSTTRVTLYFVD